MNWIPLAAIQPLNYNYQTSFYPWYVDWRTVVEILVGGFAFAFSLYLAARSGRLERKNKPDPGKPPLHWYAGMLASDSNGITMFLWALIVALVVWAVGFVLYTGAAGLKY